MYIYIYSGYIPTYGLLWSFRTMVMAICNVNFTPTQIPKLALTLNPPRVASWAWRISLRHSGDAERDGGCPETHWMSGAVTLRKWQTNGDRTKFPPWIFSSFWSHQHFFFSLWVLGKSLSWLGVPPGVTIGFNTERVVYDLDDLGPHDLGHLQIIIMVIYGHLWWSMVYGALFITSSEISYISSPPKKSSSSGHFFIQVCEVSAGTPAGDPNGRLVKGWWCSPSSSGHFMGQKRPILVFNGLVLLGKITGLGPIFNGKNLWFPVKIFP